MHGVLHILRLIVNSGLLQKAQLFMMGFELSCQEKVGLLVDYPRLSGKPYPIQVFSFNDYNCGECEKCFRKIIAIVTEGGVPSNFGFRIPGDLLNHWKKVVYNNVGL